MDQGVSLRPNGCVDAVALQQMCQATLECVAADGEQSMTKGGPVGGDCEASSSQTGVIPSQKAAQPELTEAAHERQREIHNLVERMRRYTCKAHI